MHGVHEEEAFGDAGLADGGFAVGSDVDKADAGGDVEGEVFGVGFHVGILALTRPLAASRPSRCAATHALALVDAISKRIIGSDGIGSTGTGPSIEWSDRFR